jgi:hypothetical protein
LDFKFGILDEERGRNGVGGVVEGVSVAFGSVGGGSVWKRRINRQVAKEEEGDFGWERGRLAAS